MHQGEHVNAWENEWVESYCNEEMNEAYYLQISSQAYPFNLTIEVFELAEDSAVAEIGLVELTGEESDSKQDRVKFEGLAIADCTLYVCIKNRLNASSVVEISLEKGFETGQSDILASQESYQQLSKELESLAAQLADLYAALHDEAKPTWYQDVISQIVAKGERLLIGVAVLVCFRVALRCLSEHYLRKLRLV